jgi:hypothetical protein
MEMMVKILDQEVKILNIKVMVAKTNSDTNYVVTLTFANDYIFDFYYSNIFETWASNIDCDNINKGQATTLQELPKLQNLTKLIKKEVEKYIAITSCIIYLENSRGSIISKCTLLNNIELYYEIAVRSKIEEWHVVNTNLESQKELKEAFKKHYNNSFNEFITINVRKLLKGKDGLGVNTKQFCNVIIKEERKYYE